jgi:hypothetical protein
MPVVATEDSVPRITEREPITSPRRATEQGQAASKHMPPGMSTAPSLAIAASGDFAPEIAEGITNPVSSPAEPTTPPEGETADKRDAEEARALPAIKQAVGEASEAIANPIASLPEDFDTLQIELRSADPPPQDATTDRNNYYYGLRGMPTLIARSSSEPIKIEREGNYRIPKKIFPIGQHPIVHFYDGKLRPMILSEVVGLVRWLGIDVVRIGCSVIAEANPAVILITVEAEAITEEEGRQIVNRCIEHLRRYVVGLCREKRCSNTTLGSS